VSLLLDLIENIEDWIVVGNALRIDVAAACQALELSTGRCQGAGQRIAYRPLVRLRQATHQFNHMLRRRTHRTMLAELAVACNTTAAGRQVQVKNTEGSGELFPAQVRAPRLEPAAILASPRSAPRRETDTTAVITGYYANAGQKVQPICGRRWRAARSYR
jgi:hypothetical protein